MTAPDLDALLTRHRPGQRDDLVPLLVEWLALKGWVDLEDLERIAGHVGVPFLVAWNAARGAGSLRFEPPGRWHLKVCRGTTCSVRGAEATLRALRDALGIEAGETTIDRRFSLDETVCLGECAFAPLVTVNGEVHRGVVPGTVPGLVDALRRGRRLQAFPDPEAG